MTKQIRRKANPITVPQLRRPDGYVLLLLAAGFVGSLFSSSFLPNTYLADATTIHSVIAHTNLLAPDSSFQHTADYYSILGIGPYPLAVAIFNYALYATSLWFVFRRLRIISWGTLFIIGFSVVLGVVYLAQYSKDAIVLWITIAAVTLPRNRRGEVALVGLMLLYAYFFRHYWAMVTGAYLLYRRTLARGRRPRSIVVSTIAVLAILAFGFHFVLRVPIEHYRTTVNSVRLDGGVSVNSLIHTPSFGESLLGQLTTAAVSMTYLLLPLPLALHGGVQYKGFAAGIGLLWILELLSTRRLMSCTPNRPARPPLTQRGIALALSLVSIQSLFEPDYGSYLRHLSPMVPLMILATAQLWHHPHRRHQHGVAPGVGASVAAALSTRTAVRTRDIRPSSL